MTTAFESIARGLQEAIDLSSGKKLQPEHIKPLKSMLHKSDVISG